MLKSFYRVEIILFFILFLKMADLQAMDFYIRPYLQNPGPFKMSIVFEKSSSALTTLKWGVSESELINSIRVLPQRFTRPAKKQRLYMASLKNLKPDTLYFYQIHSLGKKSKIHSFKTYPENSGSFSFLAMSDSQNGNLITKNQIENSVLHHTGLKNGKKSLYPLRFALFAGDLVEYGPSKKRWKKEFFDPMYGLMSKIPLYPALGNHEINTSYYFDYFVLEKNGTKKYLEHWYYFDHGNTRFITLDTTLMYRVKAQLDWFKKVLKDAKENPKIDFVITQFHHPHKSELWLAGELKYSGKLERSLINFTKSSGKPSLYFCGHTHGYSRGHSFETNHSMIVIGSIGGTVDNWGDYRQKDYKEYTKTLDQFGWIIAEVTVGQKPEILIKRYSFGNDDYQNDEGIVDVFKMKRYNLAPKTPIIKDIERIDKYLKIKTNIFEDEDGDSHLTTQIQVINQSSSVRNYYFQNENWYFGKNRNKGKKLTAVKFKFRKKDVLIKVRFRDSSLGWSDWAEKPLIN